MIIPEVPCTAGPSIGANLDTCGLEKNLYQSQPLGQGTTRSTSPASTLPYGDRYQPKSTEYEPDISIVNLPHSSWDFDEARELPQPSEEFLKRTDEAMGMLMLQQTRRRRTRKHQHF